MIRYPGTIPMNTEIDTTSKHTPEWSLTAVPGLYRRSTGTFYSRFRSGKRRTFLSLHTDVFTVAKLKHAEKMAEVEKSRQTGVPAVSDCRTLGSLAVEFTTRVNHLRGPQARKAHLNSLRRLRAAWPGDFDTAQPRNVTLATICQVRDRLLVQPWQHRAKTSLTIGYHPSVVNKALGTLRMMLAIAQELRAIASNPFDDARTLQDSILLPGKSRRPDLPSRADMDRIFAEMLKVFPPNESLRGTHERMARDAVEHAQFLAYSGARLEEANRFTTNDDHGDHILLRGTKTESAHRMVPVTAPLRTLIDGIKARGVTGKLLAVATSRMALERACHRLGLPKLRHHDLRHYFATVCIESGVDIPTVADWLGHADGGALLMKTYRHLRREHSTAAALKVNFKPVNAGGSTPG